MPALTRVLGALTSAYSVSILAVPGVLAKPCGLTTDISKVPADLRVLIRGIGARDLVTGVAMVVAPQAGR